MLGQASTEPKPIGLGVISTEGFESHPEFSLDGQTLYFVKSTPQFTDWKIYVSHHHGVKWTQPVPALFSGQYRDADPFITTDGKRFFFISDRPVKGKKDKSMDVWYMDWEKTHWGKPRRLGPEVNTADDEWYPTVTSDGTLYFGSPRNGSGGGCDIWRSRLRKGKYLEAENLGAPVNTSGDEIEPFITPDGKRLIFGAFRPEGLGGLDLYSSFFNGKVWSDPIQLPASINTKATELSPKLSRDGRTFYFTSVRKGVLGDIFEVDAAVIP